MFLTILDASGITTSQPLNIGTRTKSLHTCFGTVCDISFSDWLNTYIMVTDLGDILVGYANQLLSTYLDRHRKRRSVSILLNFIQKKKKIINDCSFRF